MSDLVGKRSTSLTAKFGAPQLEIVQMLLFLKTAATK